MVKTENMLQITPAGLDFGNGWIKISLDNKASKIPNWVTENEPKGLLNSATLLRGKAMGFPLEIKGDIRWFGQDTLSLSGSYEIDQDKLKPDYIRMMLKAVLWRWLDQHKINPEWLVNKRLSVVCGMPPELYESRAARNKAEKAYKFIFNQNKADYINIPNKSAIPFYTSFGGLKPETLSWAIVNKLKPGYTLLVDLGYGTSDLVLLKKGHNGPVRTNSINNGLLHTHDESNPISPWLAELSAMRGNHPSNYANQTKIKIRKVARQLSLAQLVVFG
ncbi:MAG: ParM/StbA family protein, partial [Candidatus Hodarchaeales archaeon]